MVYMPRNATKTLSHKGYGIISLMGLLDIWRIDIIEKTLSHVYFFIDISLFFLSLCPWPRHGFAR
jgi:hypothetical protein